MDVEGNDPATPVVQLSQQYKSFASYVGNKASRLVGAWSSRLREAQAERAMRVETGSNVSTSSDVECLAHKECLPRVRTIVCPFVYTPDSRRFAGVES